MGAIAERTPLDLLRQMERSGALTATSFDLSDVDLPYDQYEALGRYFGSLRDATAWWIGDWLIFGEGVYGDRAAQAAEATGRSPATLTNYLRVSMRVVRSRRRPDLSWSHHRIVAALEPSEQKGWLDKAVDERLTTGELEALVGGSRRAVGIDLPRAELSREEVALVVSALEGEGPVGDSVAARLRAATGKTGATVDIGNVSRCPSCGYEVPS